MKISEILAKYETDKVSHHNYGDAYDELLGRFDRNAPLEILEIGTQKGGSLLAWKEVFPNANVTGLDIVDVVPEKYRLDTVTRIISDVKEWKTDKTFDIIIDDGSHFESDVRYTLNNLKLKPNGIMIVEDIQDDTVWNGYELRRCGKNYDDVLLICY